MRDPSSKYSDLTNPPPAEIVRPESKRFLDLCTELAELHLRKAHDYGSGNDPLGNFNSAVRLGMEPINGVFLRMQDKMSRVEAFCTKGALQNESLTDSLRDLAAYSLLAIVIIERSAGGATNGPR